MIDLLKKYLISNIDDNLIIQPWVKSSDIPMHFRGLYDFYFLKLLDTECLLLEVKDDDLNIDQYRKHIEHLRNLWNLKVILFFKKISRYRRKSLINNRISFVIEDGQMYLPFIGLDLKETSDNIKEKKEYFSTHAQMAFLFFLYNKNTRINTTELASSLQINAMSASRALNELYDKRLVKFEIGGSTGRSKIYCRIDDPAFFNAGKVYLKSPVRKVIYSSTPPVNGAISGLDALSNISMLNQPKYRTYAISNSKLSEEKIDIIKSKDYINDNRLYAIELWDYDPYLFTKNQYVDKASLYASLIMNKDERVEQAMDEILRGESWFMA